MMGQIYAKAEEVVVWLRAERPLVPTLREADGLDNLVLQYLLNRPYWGRLWILQQYALARQITIWCANKTYTGDAIFHAARPQIECATRQDLSSLGVLQCRYAWRNSSMRMGLLELVSEFGHNMECADERDSLVSKKDLEGLGIRPDYSMSSQEVWDEVQMKCDYKIWALRRSWVGGNGESGG